MGFKEARKKAILCLIEGYVDHEVRNSIDTKNLLHTGELNNRDVIELLKQTNGTQYQTNQHFWDSSIQVHICKPVVNDICWYIKFYFIEPNVMFMSVHH